MSTSLFGVSLKFCYVFDIQIVTTVAYKSSFNIDSFKILVSDLDDDLICL